VGSLAVSRKSAGSKDCVVADAVHFEPVPGSKISLITGKIQGNFAHFDPKAHYKRLNPAADSDTWESNSLLDEQGILLREQRN
jgi:hypothetical protein